MPDLIQSPPLGVLPLRHPRAKGDATSFVGMAIFLGAWAMTFAALFFAYADVRIASASWPDSAVTAPILLPALNTLLLVGSSLTLWRGLGAVRAADPRSFGRWLLLTLLLGAGFLTLQAVVWTQMVHAGLSWGSGGYAEIFYTLTVFHALHVLVGLLGLISLVPGAIAGRYTISRHTAVRNWAMFWHFVDVIWVLIFFTVYVL